MSEKLPPPVGEDATALVLHVLRETIAQHEETIAHQVDVIVTERRAHQEYLKQTMVQADAAERRHCRLIVHTAAVEAECDRLTREWTVLVNALRNLVESYRGHSPNSIDPKRRHLCRKVWQEAEEVLKVIDQKKPR